MSDRDEQLNAVFSALAHPVRRRILELLKQGERRVSDLAAPFEFTPPAITKHLKVLENAGLVHRTRDGRVHRMRAEPGALRPARTWVQRYIDFWEHQLDALDRFLRENPE